MPSNNDKKINDIIKRLNEEKLLSRFWIKFRKSKISILNNILDDASIADNSKKEYLNQIINNVSTNKGEDFIKDNLNEWLDKITDDNDKTSITVLGS